MTDNPYHQQRILKTSLPMLKKFALDWGVSREEVIERLLLEHFSKLGVPPVAPVPLDVEQPQPKRKHRAVAEQDPADEDTLNLMLPGEERLPSVAKSIKQLKRDIAKKRQDEIDAVVGVTQDVSVFGLARR